MSEETKSDAVQKPRSKIDEYVERRQFMLEELNRVAKQAERNLGRIEGQIGMINELIQEEELKEASKAKGKETKP